MTKIWQTKTIFKILSISLFIWFGLFLSSVYAAGVLTSDLSVTTLSEETVATDHMASFTVTLTPDPVNLVTTSFDTDGQCELSHNNKPFTSGGVVVTASDKLIMRVRAVDDAVYEGNHECNISFTAVSSTELDYSTPVILSYVINIKDNDQKIINNYSVKELTQDDLKEGSSIISSYVLSISHAPSYDVVVTALADTQCDLLSGVAPNQSRVKSITKTFKAGQKTDLEFSLIAVDDSVFEGVHKCQIQNLTSTIDSDFMAVTASPFEVTILDNEVNPNIPDSREYEGGIIYFADANADGVEDTKQPSVSSFINAVNGKRQAVMLVDKDNLPVEGCQIEKGLKSSKVNDLNDSNIDSSLGEVSFSVKCDASQDYRVLWLLDSYDNASKTWFIYESADHQALRKLDYKTLVFDLGNDYTSGILMDFNKATSVKFLQSASFENPISVSKEASVVAAVNNSRLNVVVMLALAGLGAGATWFLYKRFFAYPDSAKSNYPRIDHF